MKSPKARQEFIQRLLDARGFDRLQALTEARKVGGPWLVPTLASLLDDEERIFQGPHVMELVNGVGECRLMGSQRTCDVALEVILELTKPTVSFLGEGSAPMRNYTPEERDQVRRAVGTT